MDYEAVKNYLDKAMAAQPVSLKHTDHPEFTYSPRKRTRKPKRKKDQVTEPFDPKSVWEEIGYRRR